MSWSYCCSSNREAWAEGIEIRKNEVGENDSGILYAETSYHFKSCLLALSSGKENEIIFFYLFIIARICNLYYSS